MTTRRIAIIGGGITGLAAARHVLAEREERGIDIDVVLYEADTRLGGKILTYRESGLTLEAGPDSMLAGKPAGLQLVRALGLESDLVYMNTDASETFIVRQGRLEPMPHGTFVGIPGDLTAFMQNTVISSAGKLRALFDMFLPDSPVEEDMSLGQFLRARLGDEWTNYLGEPLLAGIYAGRIDDLSLHATWKQFRDLATRHRSLILGARNVRSRSQTTKTTRSAFVTLRGGLMRMVEQLERLLSDRIDIHLGARVEQIDFADNHYTVTANRDGNSERHIYDAVIVTTPVKQMNELLSKFLPTDRPVFEVPYQSTATIVLGYPLDLVNVDLTGASGFLVPRDERRTMTASTWLSSKWPHAVPKDFVVLRCYVGRVGQDDALQLDDAELVRVVAQEVKDIVGMSPAPVFSKVTRWNHAMPNYTVGHLERTHQLKRDLRDAAPGIFVAGAGYEGLGIPDCIAQGEQAADQAISHALESVNETIL